MSAFLKHQPCPRCGSKDNLGEYEDHFWCFGCKYYKLKNDTKSIRQRLNKTNNTDKGVDNMPQNFGEIPVNAMKWLLSYGISKEDIEEYNIQWDVKNEFLVLLQNAKYFQARTFDKLRPKYLSKGQKLLTIYGTGDKLVIVEDILSAMRITRTRSHHCALPLLGSSLPYEWENEIVKKNFKEVIIWLDRDKASNALRIKRKFKQRGVDSRVIVSDNDPKEYSKGEILEWLKSK